MVSIVSPYDLETIGLYLTILDAFIPNNKTVLSSDWQFFDNKPSAHIFIYVFQLR